MKCTFRTHYLANVSVEDLSTCRDFPSTDDLSLVAAVCTEAETTQVWTGQPPVLSLLLIPLLIWPPVARFPLRAHVFGQQRTV